MPFAVISLVRMPRGIDYLIVGAGFAGCVLAERLASQRNRQVVIVERRFHVGGNAYDEYDRDGLLLHRYGPHIFHTNSSVVFEYLSKFTRWRPYQHRVRASVDGHLVPIPINLDTINTLYNLNLSTAELEEFFRARAEKLDRITTSEDVVVSRVGRELFEKFFAGYTRKQWGLEARDLDASVTARVPVRSNRDDRYFADRYQAMPLYGYTAMFQHMLSHPNIKVMLNTDYREVRDLIPYRHLVFTGPIDSYFEGKLGRLPYRSLEFEYRTADQEWAQETGTINYPNDHAFTRTTEMKHLTGQRHEKTVVVYEYPREEGDPYYPIPRPENRRLYGEYAKLAAELDDVTFVGRLGTYRYYNMDQVVAQALKAFERLPDV